MGLGPVAAIQKLKLGSLDDFDVIEINEAFAAQVLAVLKHLQQPIDPAKLNPRGGAIALGHPVGATGARLVQSALIHLQQTNQHRALISLCVGGGQGVAATLERL
jgi:acetyl-CoA acetyltransferase